MIVAAWILLKRLVHESPLLHPTNTTKALECLLKTLKSDHISSNVPGHCRLHSEIHKCLSFVLQGSFAKPRQQKQIKVPALDTNLLAPTALFQKLGMNRTGLNRTRLGSPSSVQRLRDTPWIFILKKLGCHNARTS